MHVKAASRKLAGAALFALAVAPSGAAQTATQGAYPNKPVRLIVASGAGGGLDFVARQVATPLSEAVGQAVVVDNRAGASGSIAAEVTSQAAPDGYTLMFLSASLVVYGIVNQTRYDLERDFTPVSQVAAAPYMLAVTPGLPVKSVKDLVAHAKANPEKLNYASTGNASLAHLATELFAHNTGTRLVHIPFKGVGAAMPDLVSGRLHLALLSMGSLYSQVRAGRLRGLAVASSQRVKMAPDLPTMGEAGVPGYVVTQWHGMLAPRGTPRPVIDRLHGEIVKAVRQPQVVSRLALDGTEPIASTPREFGAHLKSERAQWSKVAKVANIRGD
jgi:tripartite-type tricarboxylate transporter receptor subunit TctC